MKMSKINLVKKWLTNKQNINNNIEFLNINFEEICRFCLSSENNVNYNINQNISVNDSTTTSSISLIDIIMNFINIQVLTDDNLPQNLCENCFDTIWNAYVYQEQCKESNSILISYLNILRQTDSHSDHHQERLKTNENNQKTDSENENHSNISTASSSSSSSDLNNTNILNSIDEKASEIHHQSIDNRTTTWSYSECDVKKEEKVEDVQVTIEFTNYEIIHNKNIEGFIVNDSIVEQIQEIDYGDDDDDDGDSSRIRVSASADNLVISNSSLSSCKICQQTFTNSKSLSRHNKLHQLNSKNKLCTFCGKCFIRTDDLKRHIRTHTGERPYGCDKCPKKFKQISELKEHQQTHLKQKIYVCTICGKSLATRNGLYIHMKIHLGDKKHECQLCGRKYVTSSELTSHIRHIHSKEKPFTCNYTNCIRSFTTKLSLQSHLVAHIGAKPFKCNDCGKSYATVSSLQVHKRLHSNNHNNQLKTCSICNRQLGSAQSFNRHLRTHNSEKHILLGSSNNKDQVQRTVADADTVNNKQYECNICKKSFLFYATLKQHQKRIHGYPPCGDNDKDPLSIPENKDYSINGKNTKT